MFGCLILRLRENIILSVKVVGLSLHWLKFEDRSERCVGKFVEIGGNL